MFPQWALELLRPIVEFLSRLFWKIEFFGVENVPYRGGVIIAANHQTYMDPFWLSLKVKRPCRYLAWSAAFGWPIINRKSTRLNSSHLVISYAVFCLKQINTKGVLITGILCDQVDI